MFLLNLLFSFIICFNVFCETPIEEAFTENGAKHHQKTDGLAEDVFIGNEKSSSRSSSLGSASNINPFVERKSVTSKGDSISTFGGRKNSKASGKTYRKAKGYLFSNKIIKGVKSAFESVGILSSNTSGFLWPAQKGYISSYYGWRTKTRFHDGIDVAAPTGTHIYASKSGIVKYSNNRIRGYGNMVVIKHDETYSTVYAHNSRNLVSKGQRVRKGQVIALMGSTGHSTGPHLHFEVRKGKYSQDPLKYVSKNNKKIKK